jgi:DNA topoisomerase-1
MPESSGTSKKLKKEKTSEKKSLVIVESPAKAKTIKKILGRSYQIKASVGHIRDLPKKTLGVDLRNYYEPEYVIMQDKKKVVKDLSTTAKESDFVYLAPDPDREGEAIAWHIASILEEVPEDKIFRIEFNEITKNAIIEAMKNPRDIDMKRVDAQQARRVLDRLVGYKLSPLLWSKVQQGLSAGRVQSVAVRIICDREQIIEAFTPEEYWTIQANLSKLKSSLIFPADLIRFKDDKISLKNEQETTEALEYLKDKNTKYIVTKVNTRKTTRNPSPPFITSTLQREASNKFSFSVKKTMQIAQQLYEGIELGNAGFTGLITYMRTDSTRVADEAAESAKEFIVSHFGEEYYPSKRRVYAKKKKSVQDAHEAIRPTYVEHVPESIKEFLNKDQYRIYKLVWDRFIASQMESAQINNISNEITAGDYIFRASHSKILFKGFYIVYQSADPEDVDKDSSKNIPELKKGDELQLKEILHEQHFTQPPPRYTEATLVKTLEENGIGRPSTYAPIIATIQDRGYVIKDERTLKPTELGKVVNNILMEHFTNIVDTNFTAELEEKLDQIEENSLLWKEVVDEFYSPFKEVLKEAKEKMTKVKIESEQQCPNCGKNMVIKVSRRGEKFLACPGYPECKTTMPLTKDNKIIEQDRPSDELCDKCNSSMVIKYGPYGEYLKCTSESCGHRKAYVKKIGVTCPQCGGNMIEKKSRYGKIFYGCDNYPKCNFASWGFPTEEKCPECGSMLVKKFLKRGDKLACSSKECKYSRAAEPQS